MIKIIFTFFSLLLCCYSAATDDICLDDTFFCAEELNSVDEEDAVEKTARNLAAIVLSTFLEKSVLPEECMDEQIESTFSRVILTKPYVVKLAFKHEVNDREKDTIVTLGQRIQKDNPQGFDICVTQAVFAIDHEHYDHAQISRFIPCEGTLLDAVLADDYRAVYHFGKSLGAFQSSTLSKRQGVWYAASHGDLHTNNVLMTQKEPPSFALIDMGRYAKRSISADVFYFFFYLAKFAYVDYDLDDYDMKLAVQPFVKGYLEQIPPEMHGYLKGIYSNKRAYNLAFTSYSVIDRYLITERPWKESLIKTINQSFLEILKPI